MCIVEKTLKLTPFRRSKLTTPPSEPLTPKNTQCYHCLTPKSASLICLYRGGQFQSDEEGSICPIIPVDVIK
jgi:hypothetical protein